MLSHSDCERSFPVLKQFFARREVIPYYHIHRWIHSSFSNPDAALKFYIGIGALVPESNGRIRLREDVLDGYLRLSAFWGLSDEDREVFQIFEVFENQQTTFSFDEIVQYVGERLRERGEILKKLDQRLIRETLDRLVTFQLVESVDDRYRLVVYPSRRKSRVPKRMSMAR